MRKRHLFYILVVAELIAAVGLAFYWDVTSAQAAVLYSQTNEDSHVYVDWSPIAYSTDGETSELGTGQVHSIGLNFRSVSGTQDTYIAGYVDGGYIYTDTQSVNDVKNAYCFEFVSDWNLADMDGSGSDSLGPRGPLSTTQYDLWHSSTDVKQYWDLHHYSSGDTTGDWAISLYDNDDCDPNDYEEITITLPASGASGDTNVIFEAESVVPITLENIDAGDIPTFEVAVEWYNASTASYEALNDYSIDCSSISSSGYCDGVNEGGACGAYGCWGIKSWDGNPASTMYLLGLFPLNQYRVKIRADYPVYGTTAWSGYTYFDTLENDTIPGWVLGGGGGAGGGGGGSWGDESTLAGGYEEWNDGIDAVWALRPTCEIWSFDFTWDSGGSSTGDGMACVIEWARFLIVPPEDGYIDIFSSVWRKLITRWPLAYLTEILDAMRQGVQNADKVCPIPDIDGYAATYGTVPDVDFCATTDDVTYYMELDPYVQAVGVVIVSVLAILTAVFIGLKFFNVT